MDSEIDFRPQPIEKSPREKEEKQILKNQPLKNNRFQIV